jgi:hypothetical protein
LDNGFQTGGRLDQPGYGYIAPTGTEQLNELPWVNVDQIMVTFSENVNVALADLKLYGVNTTDYSSLITGLRLQPNDLHRHVDADVDGDVLDANVASAGR